MSGHQNPQRVAGAHAPGDGDGQTGQVGFDREIATGVLYKSSIALLVVTALSMVAMWMMLRMFEIDAATFDRPPSPLAEANERRLPPAPRLQVDPEVELQAFRAEKAERLASYGWNNRARGTVHLPIDKAMELLLADAERLNPVPAPATAVLAVAGERP